MARRKEPREQQAQHQVIALVRARSLAHTLTTLSATLLHLMCSPTHSRPRLQSWIWPLYPLVAPLVEHALQQPRSRSMGTSIRGTSARLHQRWIYHYRIEPAAGVWRSILTTPPNRRLARRGMVGFIKRQIQHGQQQVMARYIKRQTAHAMPRPPHRDIRRYTKVMLPASRRRHRDMGRCIRRNKLEDKGRGQSRQYRHSTNHNHHIP